jgi:DNA-binding beta-propeller fold protein YncE
MSSPIVYSKTRPVILTSLVAVFVVLVLQCAVMAQEAYLVSGVDGSLSAYNLATNSLIETTSAGLGKGNITVGPNQRLAFIATGNYISVIDLAIQRELQHTYAYYVAGGRLVFTPDGRYLLSFDTANQPPDFPVALDVFDAASMQLLHQISLESVLGSAAFTYPVGSIVVVGHKAYIAPQAPDQTSPRMAVVDLQTFQASAIPIPLGSFDGQGLTGYPPNAAATPDGQYVVMLETAPDSTYHLLFINTTNNSLAMDNTVTYDPLGIAISPSSNSSYGYLAALDPEGDFSAVVLDLNSGSPTFGQLLPQTEVDLSAHYASESGLAVNASGSRLLVSIPTRPLWQPPPLPTARRRMGWLSRPSPPQCRRLRPRSIPLADGPSTTPRIHCTSSETISSRAR